MASIFKAIRGTIVKNIGTKTMSVIKVDGLETFSDAMFLTQVTAQRNQVTSYIKTLDANNFGYAWGEGPGSIMVSGLIFLTKSCNVDGSAAKKIDGYFNSKNVYTSGKKNKVAIGDAVYEGYLENMTISVEQNEFNWGTFMFKFTILPKE